MTTTCFRVFLQAELDKRRISNPQYSLRAFARRLGVNHSTLSQWIRGRRQLTPGAIESLGKRLGLSARQVRVFVEHRDVVGPDLALLRLTHRQEFRADTRWIARELRVTVDEANIALQRLLRLDLLHMTARDRWLDKSETC